MFIARQFSYTISEPGRNENAGFKNQTKNEFKTKDFKTQQGGNQYVKSFI